MIWLAAKMCARASARSSRAADERQPGISIPNHCMTSVRPHTCQVAACTSRPIQSHCFQQTAPSTRTGGLRAAQGQGRTRLEVAVQAVEGVQVLHAQGSSQAQVGHLVPRQVHLRGVQDAVQGPPAGAAGSAVTIPTQPSMQLPRRQQGHCLRRTLGFAAHPCSICEQARESCAGGQNNGLPSRSRVMWPLYGDGCASPMDPRQCQLCRCQLGVLCALFLDGTPSHRRLTSASTLTRSRTA